MADYARTVLEHYQLATPYPDEWPADKDLSDASDEEENVKLPKKAPLRRSKSRYTALERATSERKSLIPGTEKAGDGTENLVQRDEPDPLGSADSVVRILRQQGLPVQDDSRLRNRFLLSSTTFSPAMFLSQVHAGDSTDDLLRGLDILSRSIDQKSASLKVLVESNFERFVRAKSTIDNVYMEMKNQGQDATPPSPRDQRRHSRHASRGSLNPRSSSGGSAINTTLPVLPITSPVKKKNALAKESEFGILGIKIPLLDVSAKAEEVWGPALGGRDREETLKVVATSVERYKEYYEIGGAIADSIKRRDYETLVDEYTRAQRFADEARKLGDTITATNAPPTDSQIQQIIVAARMWHDVQDQLEEFKRDVWKRLGAMSNFNFRANGSTAAEQHMEMIGILLELGVEDNPIWVWLFSRYEALKNKIATSSERTRIEIEILRRRLGTGEAPNAQLAVTHLRSLERYNPNDTSVSLDTTEVTELWEKMQTFLTNMLSSQGLLGEVLEFWQTIQGFLDGKTQKTLPVGLNGESRKHHRLTGEQTLELKKGTIELVDMIRECVHTFFSDAPPQDVSALFSPIPSTPASPLPLSLTPTRLRDPRFNYDANNLPPPSPRRGEAWEKFAFWPPWSNSLSAVHYLSRLLALVGSGASEMASIAPVVTGDGAALERLRTLVGSARERCVTAICAAWNKDAENIKVIEDWRRSPEKRDLTRMPNNFMNFESAILSGMQKILYVSEAIMKSGSEDVLLPPPPKLLQMARSQFVTTLYKALSGMVENAERSIKKTDDDWTPNVDGVANTAALGDIASTGAGTVNASDRNVRMLLTLSNLQALRTDIVPNLITQFENAFSVKLTDETKTIRDVLGQIDARLFQSYTRPAVESLHSIIHDGILAADWEPPESSRPKEVRAYVYDALLSLVLVHTQVSTTASSLTSQVLSYLLEQASKELLNAFKQRQRYTLSALMQATLDVEFVAQTLSQYTTDRASECQSQIYQTLDRGTDNDARGQLQGELPGMRNVLKSLREGASSEFACFKKIRRDRSVANSIATAGSSTK